MNVYSLINRNGKVLMTWTGGRKINAPAEVVKLIKETLRYGGKVEVER